MLNSKQLEMFDRIHLAMSDIRWVNSVIIPSESAVLPITIDYSDDRLSVLTTHRRKYDPLDVYHIMTVSSLNYHRYIDALNVIDPRLFTQYTTRYNVTDDSYVPTSLMFIHHQKDNILGFFVKADSVMVSGAKSNNEYIPFINYLILITMPDLERRI